MDDENEGPAQLSDIADEEGNLRPNRTSQDLVEVRDHSWFLSPVLTFRAFQLVMMRDSEVERLTRENERMQLLIDQDGPDSTSTSRRARSRTSDGNQSGSDDSEEQRPVKARKTKGNDSPGAVQLNARIRGLAKKLAVTGMLFEPELTGQAKLDHGNDGYDILAAAFNPSTPFPATEPNSVLNRNGDNFAILFNLLRWHIHDIFGDDLIKQYFPQSWFMSDVSKSCSQFVQFV